MCMVSALYCAHMHTRVLLIANIFPLLPDWAQWWGSPGWCRRRRGRLVKLRRRVKPRSHSSGFVSGLVSCDTRLGLVLRSLVVVGMGFVRGDVYSIVWGPLALRSCAPLCLARCLSTLLVLVAWLLPQSLGQGRKRGGRRDDVEGEGVRHGRCICVKGGEGKRERAAEVREDRLKYRKTGNQRTTTK